MGHHEIVSAAAVCMLSLAGGFGSSSNLAIEQVLDAAMDLGMRLSRGLRKLWMVLMCSFRLSRHSLSLSRPGLLAETIWRSKARPCKHLWVYRQGCKLAGVASGGM